MVPFRVFAPFAFGYFLSYLFRAVNAVAGPGVSADLGLEPAALGLLTSVYFLAFAAVQLPLGVLLDRFPANRVEAVLLVIAAAGSALFAAGDSIAALTVGRALIGLGVSACLMAAFKAYSTLVPPERLPFVNGLHLAVGGLGLLSGGLPSEFAIGLVGWRGLFYLLALIALIEAIALYVFGATPKPPPGSATVGEQFRAIGRILTSRPFTALAPIAVASQMTALSVQTLWAGPWLREVAGFSPVAAATILSVMAAATTIGYIASGWTAATLARRGVPLTTVAVGGMTLFLATQPAIVLLPVTVAVAAWVAFAFLAGTATLAYPALTASYPPTYSGRVNTALNFISFLAAFLAQWAVGVVVQYAEPATGVRAAYAVAFGMLAILQAGSLAWFLSARRRLAIGPPRPLV